MSLTETPIVASDVSSAQGVPYLPSAGTSQWLTISSAGAIITADNATNITAMSQIATGKYPFRRSGQGTNIILRVAYDQGQTPTTVSLQLFGRSGKDGWTRLTTASGSATLTITCAASTDPRDTAISIYGASRVLLATLDGRTSVPVPANDAFDCQNCDEFIVGVVTGLAGTVDTAYLQAKFI